MRIAALDELHSALQRESWLGCEKEMNVVGHKNKFVKLKDSAIAVPDEGFDEKIRCPL